MSFRKAAALAATATVAVLTLSGCMRLQGDVYVTSDAQVDKAVSTIALNKEAMKQLGGMGGGGEEFTLEQFKQGMLEENSDDADLIQEKCEFTESDTEFVMACTFEESDPAFAETMGDLGGEVALVKEGSTIVATLQTQNALESAGGDELSAMLMGGSGINARLLVHFPGAVQEVSGAGVSIDTADPNVAVVDLMKTDGGTVTMKASDGAGNLLPLLIGGGVLVLAVIGLIVYFVSRRGETGSTEATPPLLRPEDLDPPTV